jgi:membrane-associated phospholipid phosphatase
MERSFPSGHTCGAFSLYCLLSMLLVPKYKWLGMVCFIFAISTAYSRIYLAAHFFEDVYAGSIIGTCIATGVVTAMNSIAPYFFKRPKTLR